MRISDWSSDVCSSDLGMASDHDFLWLHLDGRDERTIATIQSDEGIPAIARSALLAHETRPRCAVLTGGALINLRGLGSTPEDDPDRSEARRVGKGCVGSVDLGRRRIIKQKK